ncbi:fumarylacetoacetate hydrolase family protein [Comamonas endophytica]|uniref:Fumarylacetoacetate hydrolase family protein n=2 Tax=Comamonas endophytica TaxID=2949090 RepID=A0ABY6G8S5_9BURK|nr:fumarylacetoacetate hydrolase family protein [Acidovorax sp. 5MLIR]UYG51318.1 fumarylacetoacetate hydrolase family protein [Acidovorax sp. 5MLIR]
MRAPEFHKSQVLQALREAHQSGVAADASGVRDDIDVLAVLQHAAAAGGWRPGSAPAYWKSGGPSPALPLFHAPLPTQGVLPSHSERNPARIGQPACTLYGVEAEIALRIGRRVDRALALTLTADSVHGLVDAMTVAIEWVDSRWRQNLQAPLPLLQADRLSHGALVLGQDWLPYLPRDWSAQRCTVQIDAEAVREFKGSHPLGDPSAVLLPWLLHATEHWGSVEAGSVVTTGSWTGILQARAGSRVGVSFDGLAQAWLEFGAGSSAPPFCNE